MTSYRRTRSAILEGTKSLIATVGLQRTNMIEIADCSEVSRATLYNHFRDKNSVLRALLENEVERVLQLVEGEISPAQALVHLSSEISSDPALAMMRKTDPAILAQLFISIEDSFWQKIHSGLHRFLKNENLAQIAQLWLVGQVFQPVTGEQAREQAHAIASSMQQHT